MDRIVIRELLVRCVLGVDDEERREMQDVLITVTLHADLRRAGESDRLEDAIDYREVAAAVREVNDGPPFRLLEALATTVADALVARFPAERVRVRVRKPEVRPAGVEVEFSAVTVERPAPS